MKLEKALVRFAAITRGGGYKMTELYVKTVGAGPLGDKIVSCVSQIHQREMASKARKNKELLTLCIYVADAIGARKVSWSSDGFFEHHGTSSRNQLLPSHPSLSSSTYPSLWPSQQGISPTSRKVSHNNNHQLSHSHHDSNASTSLK